MGLANCERCNRVFNKIKSPLCSACVEKEEKEFQMVNEALREQPDQTIDQLAESTGVDTKTILRLLKQGRIASDSNLVQFRCGRCGAPATSASVRLCERCAAQIATAAAQACSKTGKTGEAVSKEGGEAVQGSQTVHDVYLRKKGAV